MLAPKYPSEEALSKAIDEEGHIFTVYLDDVLLSMGISPPAHYFTTPDGSVER